MKVLAISANFDRCEASMLSSIAKQGIDIHVVTEPNARYNELLGEQITDRFEIKFKSRFDLKGIFKLRRIIKKTKPDILHLFSARAVANGLIASWGLPIKRVAYRGTMGHLSRFDPSSHLSFLNPGLHKIICVSHAVEKYLAAVGIPAERRITIHKGHYISWYTSSGEITRKEFSLPNDAVVVGCVANVRPVKGIDILVKAFSALFHEKNLYLLLIGDIRDKKVLELISSATNSSNIICTGFRSDAPDVIGLADIFVMPSIAREGLPKALIEAMAKGIAPIVTNVGGMPEVVVDGVNGLVVPPSNVSELSASITRLAKDSELREKFSRAAPKRISEAFNIEDTVIKTMQVYAELSVSPLLKNITNG